MWIPFKKAREMQGLGLHSHAWDYSFWRLHVLVPSIGNVRSMQLNDEVARFFRWLHSSHIVTETYYGGYDSHGG